MTSKQTRPALLTDEEIVALCSRPDSERRHPMSSEQERALDMTAVHKAMDALYDLMGGTYAPGTVGEHSGPAQVMWNEDGVVYMLGEESIGLALVSQARYQPSERETFLIPTCLLPAVIEAAQRVLAREAESVRRGRELEAKRNEGGRAED